MNLRAAIVSLGTSTSLSSSVTVATTTTVLSCLFPRCLTSLVSETGGLLVLDAINLLRTVLQNAESVLLLKNLKSYSKKKQLSDKHVQAVSMMIVAYLDQEMVVKILASCVFLVVLLKSASARQINTL